MPYAISLIDIIMKNFTALTWGVSLGVLLASFLFSNGFGMSLLPSHVNNWQWTNVIPLLQMKTADTAHTGKCNPVPFPNFWAGPGDRLPVLGSWGLVLQSITKFIAHEYF